MYTHTHVKKIISKYEAIFIQLFTKTCSPCRATTKIIHIGLLITIFQPLLTNCSAVFYCQFSHFVLRAVPIGGHTRVDLFVLLLVLHTQVLQVDHQGGTVQLQALILRATKESKMSCWPGFFVLVSLIRDCVS